MQIARNLRIIAVFAVAGALVGLGISNVIWGYWIYPPTLSRAVLGADSVVCVSVFKVWRNRLGEPLLEGREVLSHEQWRTRGLAEDVGFDRIVEALRRLPARRLDHLTGINPAIATDLLMTVPGPKPTHGTAYVTARDGALLVVSFVRHGKSELLAAFRSSEVTNDRYEYLEAIVPSLPAARAVVHWKFYRFDIAGLEFLTPWLLAAMTAFIAGIAASVIVLVAASARGIRARIERMGSGLQDM